MRCHAFDGWCADRSVGASAFHADAMGQWDSVGERGLRSFVLPQFAPLYRLKPGPHTATARLRTIATAPSSK